MNTLTIDKKIPIYRSEVIKIISTVFGLDEIQVHADLRYQSVSQWDSLRHINLMLTLEKIYGITIESNQVTALASVQAIIDFIEEKMAKKMPNSTKSFAIKSKIENKVEINRGLNGVIYDNSTISLIDGNNGKLLHRGYTIQDLAVNSTFEEISYLLLYDKLPTKNELSNFKDTLRSRRMPCNDTYDFIKFTKQLTPTQALRTIISALPVSENNNSSVNLREYSLDLIACMPFLIAAHYRVSKNLDLILPNIDLSHAANFLYMLTGRMPNEMEAQLLDQDMVLHAEHGSNASTFVARIVTSTQADVTAAVTAAIATFSGDLHGGALEKVFSMLKEIDKPENAAAYVRNRMQNNLPVYGFGHRVYRTEDPRAVQLRKAARLLSIRKGEMKWLHILNEVNKAMQPYAKLGMNPNVDLYAAVTYHLLGIPQELFVPVFIMSRISGWIAHIEEQSSNNILIRPRLNYVGECERQYISVSVRAG